MKKRKVTAITYKDNFWSRKRVEQDVTIKDIAELLGINSKTASAYFTGQAMPHEHQIATICEFFGVDLVEGTREFDKAFKSYDAEKKRTLKASAKKPYVHKRKKKTTDNLIADNVKVSKSSFMPKVKISTDDTVEFVVPKEKPMKVTNVSKKFIGTDNFLELVYGKISRETYDRLSECLANGTGDPLELIYKQVDYQTFRNAENALERKLDVFVTIDDKDAKWEI